MCKKTKSAIFLENPRTQQIQRNWVIATNSDVFPLSLQPNVVDPRYFKL